MWILSVENSLGPGKKRERRPVVPTEGYRHLLTRIRPPESSVHTIAWTSVFDAWLGSKKARSSASDLISASGAEPVWSSAPYTYRDSAAVGLSLSQESGGARRKSPRSRNRWVPSCRPNQERYRVALWGRPQLSPGSGEGQSHRETEVGRERGCPINKPRCRAMCPRTPRGAQGHRSRDRRGASRTGSAL